MTNKRRESLKVILVFVSGVVLSLVAQAVVAFFWSSDSFVPWIIVSVLLRLLILNLTMLVMLKMSRRKWSDGSYIWSDRGRRVAVLGCWIVAAISVTAVLILLYAQFV
jgi:hypothetical protein